MEGMDDVFSGGRMAMNSSRPGGRRRRLSGGAPKDVCHVAKEFVSCHMAVEVVYFFETVQIHEEKGVGFFAVQFFCCVEDAAVVQEAGEGVMPCHAEGCFFSCASSAWDRIWKK